MKAISVCKTSIIQSAHCTRRLPNFQANSRFTYCAFYLKYIVRMYLFFFLFLFENAMHKLSSTNVRILTLDLSNCFAIKWKFVYIYMLFVCVRVFRNIWKIFISELIIVEETKIMNFIFRLCKNEWCKMYIVIQVKKSSNILCFLFFNFNISTKSLQ